MLTRRVQASITFPQKFLISGFLLYTVTGKIIEIKTENAEATVTRYLLLDCYRSSYSLSPGFWQSFVTIGVHKDHIPALARFCKKQLTGFFVRLLFFVKCKHYH